MPGLRAPAFFCRGLSFFAGVGAPATERANALMAGTEQATEGRPKEGGRKEEEEAGGEEKEKEVERKVGRKGGGIKKASALHRRPF